jgi:hypothetical protein
MLQEWALEEFEQLPSAWQICVSTIMRLKGTAWEQDDEGLYEALENTLMQLRQEAQVRGLV